MHDNSVFAEYRSFEGVNEAWELQRTGMIVVHNKMYRLELWHCHSNVEVPYYVSVYVSIDNVWRRLPDPPFTVALDGDEALRRAMMFVSERFAA